MHLTPFVIAWIGLGITTGLLAAYRQFLTMHEDDNIHIEEWQKPATVRQVAETHRIELIDQWGQGLTILMAVSGLVLGAAYLYWAWLGR